MFFVWGIYNWFKTGLVRAILSGGKLDEAGTAALVGIALVSCMIIPYLLGSVNWALVISKLVYHDDIRRHGSGNAGATNMLRTYGKAAAACTFLGDGLKGVISVVYACLIFGHPTSEGGYLYLITAAYMAAFFAVLGHAFPCFAHFRGGKGFATTSLLILALNPGIFCILLFVFFPLVLLSRYVSLGSVVTAMFYPLLLGSFDSAFTKLGIHVLFALLIGLLVTWCHRGNLKRISEGTERKLKLWYKDAAPAEGVCADTDADEGSDTPKKTVPKSEKNKRKAKKAQREKRGQ